MHKCPLNQQQSHQAALGQSWYLLPYLLSQDQNDVALPISANG